MAWLQRNLGNRAVARMVSEARPLARVPKRVDEMTDEEYEAHTRGRLVGPVEMLIPPRKTRTDDLIEDFEEYAVDPVVGGWKRFKGMSKKALGLPGRYYKSGSKYMRRKLGVLNDAGVPLPAPAWHAAQNQRRTDDGAQNMVNF